MSVNRGRRAIFLVELLAMLVPATVLLGLLGFLITDFVNLQRLAGQHASRMAISDSFCNRLQADIAAATSAGWSQSDAGTSVQLRNSEGSPIEYLFESTRMTRRVAGVEDSVWTEQRLQFDCDFPIGSHAPLLRLALVEQPPEVNHVLPPRRYVTVFVLPPTITPLSGVRP